MDYLIVDIAGKQFKVKKDQILEVPFLGELKSLECNKVLAISEKGKLELGSPYLKKTVNFEVLSSKPTKKIRVAIFKAKANYRRVNGSRSRVSLVKLMTA